MGGRAKGVWKRGTRVLTPGSGAGGSLRRAHTHTHACLLRVPSPAISNAAHARPKRIPFQSHVLWDMYEYHAAPGYRRKLWQVLVGGSTRIPVVQKMLSDMFAGIAQHTPCNDATCNHATTQCATMQRATTQRCNAQRRSVRGRNAPYSVGARSLSAPPTSSSQAAAARLRVRRRRVCSRASDAQAGMASDATGQGPSAPFHTPRVE